MSQGRSEIRKTAARQDSANSASLFEMVARGKSWSGRERNCCFLNTAGPRFADISAACGLDFPDDGRGAAALDWDGDGDLDLWTVNFSGPQVRFFRNDSPAQFHHLSIRLEGRTSNRDAIGARVEVHVDDDSRKLVKSLRAGEGFLSQSSKWLHFGLGDADRVERITVHWPGGEREEFAGPLATDRRYLLIQGTRNCEELDHAPRRPPEAADPSPPPVAGTMRVVLSAPPPLPGLPYETLDNQPAVVTNQRGPVLINLWASWCAPCIAELTDFAHHEQALEEADVKVFALCVDGLADANADRAAVAALAARLNSPLTVGWATPPMIEKLDLIHDKLFDVREPLSLPTSLLITRDGRLATIYKGRLEVEQLLADVRLLDASPEQLAQASVPVPGNWRRMPAAESDDWVARLMFEHGYDQDALLLCRAAVANRPQDATAHYNLAVTYDQLGETRLALAQFQRAVELAPDDVELRDSLAMALMSAGEPAGAESQLRALLDRSPGDVPALVNLGIVLAQQDKFPEAGRRLKEALSIAPHHAQAHNNLGILAARQGRLQEAVQHFQAALEGLPDDISVRENLIRAMKALEQDANP